QLEDEERRVTLVQVPHRRLDAERTQRAHAADAENHLLANARRVVPAVEAVRDVAVRGRILRAVGVEQVDGRAPGLRLPGARHHVAPGGAYAHLEPFARCGTQRLDRQVARIALAVLGLLVAVVVDGLG